MGCAGSKQPPEQIAAAAPAAAQPVTPPAAARAAAAELPRRPSTQHVDPDSAERLAKETYCERFALTHLPCVLAYVCCS